MPRTSFVQRAQYPHLYNPGFVESQARLVARRVTQQRRQYRDQLRKQRMEANKEASDEDVN